MKRSRMMNETQIKKIASSKPGWFAPGHPAQLAIGFTIWSIWFIAMYGGLSVACQLAAPGTQQGPYTWLNGGLLVLTLLTIALLLLLAWRNGRYYRSLRANAKATGSVSRFIGYVSTVLYLLAAVATLASGLPVLVFTPCS